MNDTLLRNAGALLLVGLSIGLAGCSSQGEDQLAPAFTEKGQEKGVTAAYPNGPFGVKKGAIISNYKFVGFPNVLAVKDSLDSIELSHFYNPTGTDVYPEGSPYGAGQAKPKVLLIDVASVWCGPCNQEAGTVLPGQHKKEKPLGGEFLLQLADGPQGGISATQLDLSKWTTKYMVNKGEAYPATYDPEYKLGALFEADAFPANMIIDTRTMKICEVIAGAPDPTDTTYGGKAFWDKYEAVAKDSSACK